MSLEERQKLKFLKKKGQEIFIDSSREILLEELERDKQHQNLVKLCAKAFAQTNLSSNTGYEFYFTEPLTEFSEDQEGNKNFDLLLVNETDHTAIFIECKTSIPVKAKEILKDTEEKIRLIQKKIDYLKNLLRIEIDLDKIEFVLCVYDKDSKKIIDSINAQLQRKSGKNSQDLASIKLWIYRPHIQRIQLFQRHAHKNLELTKMLLRGFGEEDLRNQFELPYCLTTHNYRLIRLIILGNCYAKNLQLEEINDPKIIRISDIFDTMEKNISLGMTQEQKNELISEKMEKMLKFGERYQIFERISPDEIKLNCQGKRLDLVLNNIQEKFFKKWIDDRAEREAEKYAIDTYKKQRGMTQLSDF